MCFECQNEPSSTRWLPSHCELLLATDEHFDLKTICTNFISRMSSTRLCLLVFVLWKRASAICYEDQFTCLIGPKCIPILWLCDGARDCPDGSDEGHDQCHPHLTNITCPGNQPDCIHGGVPRCIPENWLCDGHQDCDHGEDEINCGKMEKNGGCGITQHRDMLQFDRSDLAYGLAVGSANSRKQHVFTNYSTVKSQKRKIQLALRHSVSKILQIVPTSNERCGDKCIPRHQNCKEPPDCNGEKGKDGKKCSGSSTRKNEVSTRPTVPVQVNKNSTSNHPTDENVRITFNPEKSSSPSWAELLTTVSRTTRGASTFTPPIPSSSTSHSLTTTATSEISPSKPESNKKPEGTSTVPSFTENSGESKKFFTLTPPFSPKKPFDPSVIRPKLDVSSLQKLKSELPDMNPGNLNLSSLAKILRSDTQEHAVVVQKDTTGHEEVVYDNVEEKSESEQRSNNGVQEQPLNVVQGRIEPELEPVKSVVGEPIKPVNL
ncbi:hypothetical protein RB195_012562 [Necator americanus]|uniref:Low-density lipoprotein receptor domain class A n=1 Tax=Necator americanus TaxID=51031 RepID=A0ABR1DSM7_NECAM